MTMIRLPQSPHDQPVQGESTGSRGRRFRFEGSDAEGRRSSGAVRARNRHDAGRRLSREGVFVSRLASDEVHTSIRRAPRARKAQLANQMWQLATMVEAGIGLGECLDCLARQGSDPRLKALLQDTSAQVQNGKALSEAMSRHPRSYPASIVAMIRASEHSGSLAKVLRQCAVYLDKDLRLIARMRAALMYPALLLGITGIVLVFLLTFVLPKFSVIFASRGADLPVPTQVLLALSNSIVSQWGLWLLGTALVVGSAWWWYRTPTGRRVVDRATVTVPGVRTVSNALYQSRAFRALAMLVEARVSLIDAVAIVRDIVPNSAYQDLWDDLDEQMKVGEHFAAPLFHSEIVEEAVAQMIDKGDRAGKLGLALSRVADFLEEKYERTIGSAVQFLEPALLLLIGGIIGVVVISMMLPLFQAAQVVAG